MHNTSELFPCDPLKNTMCRKTNCFLYGGSCEHTAYRQYKLEELDMDRLAEMLDTQAKFQYRLDPGFFGMSVKERVAFIKEHSIHLNQEVNEMLYELPFFKPWKDYSDMSVGDTLAALEKAKMECVDAWHFFMNIMLALGFTPEEFHHMYMAKNKENHRRQDAGYTAAVSYRDQKVEEVMHDEQD